MKRIFTLVFLLNCLVSQSQLIADPALSQVVFTDSLGNVIIDSFPLGSIVRLNIPIKNLDSGNGLPGGTCKIKVGLGSKLILAPGFDLSTVSGSQYFEWIAENNSGQIQLTGELKNNLPASYATIAVFEVQGSILDFSTITANFLVTNHNAPVVLSDNNPSNNSSFRRYRIIPPIITPVNFREVVASINDCEMKVQFFTENEINVSRYDVETSDNGVDFVTSKTLTARNSTSYVTTFLMPTHFRQNNVFVRIKSIDMDGQLKYSETRRVTNTCAYRKPTFTLYPNPMNYGASTILQIKSSVVLTGNYHIQLYSANGKQVMNKMLVANNTDVMTTAVPQLAKGMYWLNILDDDGIRAAIISVQIQ
jgi:hypothetical protein